MPPASLLNSPDVAVASAICERFGVEHEIVRVPRDPDTLIDDCLLYTSPSPRD